VSPALQVLVELVRQGQYRCSSIAGAKATGLAGKSHAYTLALLRALRSNGLVRDGLSIGAPCVPDSPFWEPTQAGKDKVASL
jgi:hypothetical protein